MPILQTVRAPTYSLSIYTLFSILFIATLTLSFTPHPSHLPIRHDFRLRCSESSGGGDLEAQRLSLERVLSTTKSLPKKKSMSSVARLRLEKEIELIQSLNYDVNAIDNMWKFWFGASGKDANDELVEAELLCRSSDTYHKGEDKLRNLIHRYPNFTEAKNRLATLLFMKGMTKESASLCEVILREKPWHFGAISGAVLCYQRLGNLERAKWWNLKQMPRGLGDERGEWCRNHVQNILDENDGSCSI
mmetsp:Transcript_12024/g.24571  ORF Transcript_12024/g.24571 Transcript_12024/m.24571 type:complete len:247 (+) Transcript_12024:192-932(+)